jgi:Dolichyl-phosphate-mannose-protein mannosyltransferase
VSWTKVAITSIMLLTFGIMVWGLTGDCPFKPEGDEQLVVGAALGMVHDGTLNPHYLGHPASTIIYPLCVYYHFLNATVFHGAISDPYFSPNELIFSNVFLLCYLPRLLNVIMMVGLIPILYEIGKDVFGKGAAIFGICIFPINELLLVWGQVLRSDVSAMFYSMLAICFSLRSYRQPSTRLNALAAVSIGLAIGSRWPSMALLSIYLFLNAKLFWDRRRSADKSQITDLVIAGLVIAFGTFALTTPYVFIEPATLARDLAEEKAAHGLGCDGLSPAGNFLYYLSNAIPRTFYQPQAIMAAAGILVAVWQKNFMAAGLAIYVLAVLCGTSIHIFHTDKWLLPIFPILALFAGHFLAWSTELLSDLLWTKMTARRASFLCTFLAVCFLGYIEVHPFLKVCQHNTSKMLHSTDKTFYTWVFDNIPEGTPICFVGAWDGGRVNRYKIQNVLWDPSYFDTECHGRYLSPYDLYDKGFKYFVWNSYQGPLYLAEPSHYPRECLFFKELFDNTELVKEVTPRELSVYSLFKVTQPGPTFRLYRFVPKVPRKS